MGDRLRGETGDEFSGDQVTGQGHDKDGRDTEKEVAFFKEDQVAECAHGAEAGPLGEHSHEQPGSQGHHQGSVL